VDFPTASPLAGFNIWLNDDMIIYIFWVGILQSDGGDLIKQLLIGYGHWLVSEKNVVALNEHRLLKWGGLHDLCALAVKSGSCLLFPSTTIIMMCL